MNTAPTTPSTTGKPDLAPLAPPQMRPEGFPLLLKEICGAATKGSEAHPVAVASNVLAFFCALIGRTAFQRIGDAVLHCRLFALIVGKSGKARKGTAEHLVRALFATADALFSPIGDRLRIHAGGLSTGEGIAYAIRDPVEPDENGKGGDQGVKDKRLLVIESEFSNVLAQFRREGNTLSSTIRNTWDGRTLAPLTKSQKTCASNPHVVTVGHITGFEFRQEATENDAANGVLNRFMVLFVYRPKLVPLPSPTPREVIDQLAERIADAATFATGGSPHGNCEHEVTMSDAARALWCELYPHLTKDREGQIGSLMARTEIYGRMLAMIFALLDCRDVIEPQDIRAAVAWIDYWAESVAFIFRSGDGDEELDPFAREVYELIKLQPGISLSEINEHWHRHKTKAVRKALEMLLNLAPPLVIEQRDDTTGGRAAKRYHSASVSMSVTP